MNRNVTRNVMKDRRWQLAWWGTHIVGWTIAAVCVGTATSWWIALALIATYFTGFVAAVLVEIATA